MVYYNTSTLNFPLMFYSLIRELKDLAWTDASQGARERTKWRDLVHGPSLHRERRKLVKHKVKGSFETDTCSFIL